MEIRLDKKNDALIIKKELKKENTRKDIHVHVDETGHVKLEAKFKSIPLDVAETAINEATKVMSAWLNKQLLKDVNKLTKITGLLILTNILFMMLWLAK